jgi:hypothetical protein
MAMYDPSKEKSSGACGAGRKVLHPVGYRLYNSSKKGTQMLDIAFVCLRDLAEIGDEKNSVRARFALVDAAMFRYGAFCQAIGYTQPHDPTKPEVIEKMLANAKPIIGTVKVTEWEGNERPEVDKFAKYRGEQDPEWDEMIAHGEASWQKYLAKIEEKEREAGRGGSRSSGSSARSSAPDEESYSGGGGGDTDDIPF